MMLVVYGSQDYIGGNNTGWLDDKIVFIFHSRTEAFDDFSMQQYVRKEDGEENPSGIGKKKNVYRHHIPYHRIYVAIEDTILNESFTRRGLLEWLEGTCEALGINPDESLRYSEDPLKARLIYDIWVDWAVSAICQFRDNIFFGPGTGDGAGTKLDFPTGTKMKLQAKRLQKGQTALLAALPYLNINYKVPLDRSSYKSSDSDIRKDEALAKLEKRLLADAAAYVAREGLWGYYPVDDSDDPDFEPPKGWEDYIEKQRP